jgi:hypothetical protein
LQGKILPYLPHAFLCLHFYTGQAEFIKKGSSLRALPYYLLCLFRAEREKVEDKKNNQFDYWPVTYPEAEKFYYHHYHSCNHCLAAGKQLAKIWSCNICLALPDILYNIFYSPLH